MFKNMPFAKSTTRLSAVIAGCLLLSACGAAELAINLVQKQNREAEKRAIATGETSVIAAPRYKVGDPYQVAGVWYYPERNLKYDETGVGSWYGDEFAGRLTANGEILTQTKSQPLIKHCQCHLLCV